MNSATKRATKAAPRFVVVVRHGERLDYVSRDDLGVNWTAQADRPYDPPLTEHGKEQALKLGQHLVGELERLGIPPITAIYTSPFLRCLQTSLSAREGLSSMPNTDSTSSTASKLPPVRVEYGLSESFNNSWFRSWSLPGSDGTWGFRLERQNGTAEYDPETLHPWSRQPIQHLPLFEDWKSTTAGLDLDYESKTSIKTPFSFDPLNLETREQQCARMKAVVETVTQNGDGCVMLTSHGAPVLHLFEELTGQPWTNHGKSVYCCYPIYKWEATHDDEDGEGKTTIAWVPLAVNESKYLQETLDGDNYIAAEKELAAADATKEFK